MLEITARDGAGRAGQAQIGARRLPFPAIFWLTERTPEGSGWEPGISKNGDQSAALVRATTRFTEDLTMMGSGQVLLQRRLHPAASMMEGQPLLQIPAEPLAVWGHAASLFRNPKDFAPALARARADAGFHRVLYAPGLGEPATLGLLVYAGVDAFDAVPLLYAAAKGEYLTESGRYDAATLNVAQCHNPCCRGRAPADLSPQEIAQHNQWAARAELGVVHNALAAGRLRELVEARCRAHPELTALLRRLDGEHDYFEARTPVARLTQTWANTKESLQRPEYRRFRERVMTRYRPPTSPPVLLLLPCSARKPYSKSRTHRAFADALWSAGAAGMVHEVILTSPLGLVPRELELTYPAAHYDVPVTGEWDEEEATMIRALLTRLLALRAYARVVSHLPKHTYEIVRDLLPADTLVTCEVENPTNPDALKRLELTLRELTKQHGRARLEQVQLERLRALSDYQFGPVVTDCLFAGAHVTGKWPTGIVREGATQLAMLPTDRGLLSLTIAGAQRLMQTGQFAVEIDDFQVKGSIFAVGVKGADPQIRPGDDVVIHHAGQVRGVGVAQMSGLEMTQVRKGEAVKVRHHA